LPEVGWVQKQPRPPTHAFAPSAPGDTGAGRGAPSATPTTEVTMTGEKRMKYVIQYHNGYNHDVSRYLFRKLPIYGPFDTIEEATSYLQYIVDLQADELFKIRTDEFRKIDPNELGYAGYDAEELEKADRDEDLAAEIWAQIHLVFPPNR
jgi:hypothetical protein